MEPKQIEKRLSWLDEQRIKDNDTLARLTERQNAFEENLAKEVKQLQDLSGELARLTALTTRIHQIDETLAKHRKEVSRQLAEAEKRRSEKERAIEDMRKSDQKSTAKSLDEIRAELEKFEAIEQSLGIRKDEELRLSRTMDELETKFENIDSKNEEYGRQLSTIDEGRKQDSRRVVELQSETSDLRKKSETIQGRLDSIDDRIRRTEIALSELSTSETERGEAMELWTERQELKLVEFEREWKQWSERFSEFDRKAAEFDERILSYEETYRNLKYLRKDLDDIIERLERRINEITEMQRLSDDRLKQDWTTFQADDQKRWNTYKLTADEQWRDHSRIHEKIDAKTKYIEELAEDSSNAIGTIASVDRERVLALLAILQDWASELET
jgi:chromosome segregation ATPase